MTEQEKAALSFSLKAAKAIGFERMHGCKVWLSNEGDQDGYIILEIPEGPVIPPRELDNLADEVRFGERSYADDYHISFWLFYVDEGPVGTSINFVKNLLGSEAKELLG
jgi:hypothetical protein